MMKYQLVFKDKNEKHAGSKAPADVYEVAKKLRYNDVLLPKTSLSKNFFIKLLNFWSCYFEYKKFEKKVEDNSIVLYQFPVWVRSLLKRQLESSLLRLKNRGVIIITVVHDVEELRFGEKKSELDFLIQISNFIICHNDKMIDYFVYRGANRDKLINLKLFDYLTDCKIEKKQFDKSVVIAGNLSKTKSPYLENIHLLKSVNFNLYGINYDNQDEYHNIIYNGAFEPEILPSKLHKGFGLVWDGNSIDTCSGQTGNYLKYNNPHKLSLYIASGLPVIVWSESALSSFVKDNNLGFAVNSLYEIENVFNNLTDEEYDNYCMSVEKFSLKLRAGYFMTNSLKVVESLIGEIL